jgi:hypothetical protein
MASQIQRQTDEPFFKEPREFKKRDGHNFPVGPRTERRQKENNQLNKLPTEIKNHCELKLPGCIKTVGLSWAHSRKSRFLLTSKDWQEACRACSFCHQTAEAMSHSEMHRLITEAIKRRKI